MIVIFIIFVQASFFCSQADLDRHLRDIIDRTRQLIPTIIKEILICNDQMGTCLQEISSLYKLSSSFSSNDSEGIHTEIM